MKDRCQVYTGCCPKLSFEVEKSAKAAIPEKDNKAVLLIHGSGGGYGYWDIKVKGYSCDSMMSLLRGFSRVRGREC